MQVSVRLRHPTTLVRITSSCVVCCGVVIVDDLVSYLVVFAPVNVGATGQAGSVEHVRGFDLCRKQDLVCTTIDRHSITSYPLNVAQNGFAIFKSGLAIFKLVPQLGELLTQEATNPAALAVDQKLLRGE